MTVLTLIADVVVWRLPGTVPDYSGTYEGQTSVANFFEKLKSTVEIEGFEPRDFVADPERQNHRPLGCRQSSLTNAADRRLDSSG